MEGEGWKEMETQGEQAWLLGVAGPRSGVDRGNRKGPEAMEKHLLMSPAQRLEHGQGIRRPAGAEQTPIPGRVSTHHDDL